MLGPSLYPGHSTGAKKKKKALPGSGEQEAAAASAPAAPTLPPEALGDASPITALCKLPLGHSRHLRPAATMWAKGLGGLKHFCHPGKGRGLWALEPFQVGNLLFSCLAYAYVLTVNERGNHCEY
ncbi:N-lysine methyltransferase SMYD2 [Plecturocebus cupreus]